ncbi:zinc-binding dehydrogenase [Corynebacterium matruchotii]|uniref:zinc-binding dehydrogenase n=1 Tax=Corynebacterium matruchotii TaxID=43768 RepID=UPI002431E44C|nr:zinc-binding dehydrogenase [Corynebacterium matruchotii]
MNKLQKFDCVLDLIGPSAIRHSFAVLKRGGIVCDTGLLGGQWTLENFDPIIDTCGGYLTGYHSGDATADLLQEAITIIEDHAIDVTPHKVLPLKEAARAHTLMESGAGYGKYVLLPEH